MNKADYSASLQGNTYSFAKDGESVNITVTDVPQWVNENNQRQTAASLNAATPTASCDVITYPNLLGTGANLEIELQTARLAKKLTVPNINTFSTPSLSGTVSLALNFRFQRSNGVAIFVDGVQWNEATNNPRLTTSRIEFQKAGLTLFAFNVPFAVDADHNTVTGSMYVRKSGANLFVEVRIPYSWMQSATFPITIDPTIDEQKSGNTYDCCENRTGDALYVNGFDSDGDRVGHRSGNEWDIGWVFQDVDIAFGVTVDVAYLQGYGKFFSGTIQIAINGILEADTGVWSTPGNHPLEFLNSEKANSSWGGGAKSWACQAHSISPDCRIFLLRQFFV